MQAITVLQPWATLIAIGAKTNETRGWSTPYRGLLAIHAGKGYPKELRQLELEEPFHTALMVARARVVDPLPLGAIVAVARLSGIKQVTSESDLTKLSRQELAFGDYSSGRYVWALRDVYRLPVPIEARGKQGLWQWQPPAGFVYPANLQRLPSHA